MLNFEIIAWYLILFTVKNMQRFVNTIQFTHVYLWSIFVHPISQPIIIDRDLLYDV